MYPCTLRSDTTAYTSVPNETDQVNSIEIGVYWATDFKKFSRFMIWLRFGLYKPSPTLPLQWAKPDLQGN